MIKTIILTIILTLATHSDFCHGWERGYAEGYCYEEDFCFPPISPICPLPNIGEDQYDDGYNRGFIKGLKDRK